VLSNYPNGVLDESELKRLITEGDLEEVRALLCNANIDTDILKALYANEGLFAAVPDERRRELVLISADNPRLTTNDDSEHGPDLGHRSIHKAIVTMLETAPTTEQWQHALRGLLEKLDPLDVPRPDAPITPILLNLQKCRDPLYKP
jgi:hypothetical protein